MSPGAVLTGMPALHHVMMAGGLLALLSQVKVAFCPGFNLGGSCLMTTFSGGSETIDVGYSLEQKTRYTIWLTVNVQDYRLE